MSLVTIDDKQVMEIVQPMLDMFSGTDGGIGFVKFRHHLMPLLVERVYSNTCTYQERDLLTKIIAVSNLCNRIMTEDMIE